MSHLLFKGYGAINLRLPEDPGEVERQDACEQPDKHAADRKVRHHAGRSVARKAEQMATVMDKFVNIHTLTSDVAPSSTPTK
jgi:hypothetical protein